MVVGEFDYIETHYGDRNIPIRVYTLPGKAEQGRFGLGVAKRAMEWYEDYFNFKSPLPKVDLVAMPDFSMGKYYVTMIIEVNCQEQWRIGD